MQKENEFDKELNKHAYYLEMFNNLPDRAKLMYLVDTKYIFWGGSYSDDCKSPIEIIFNVAISVYQYRTGRNTAYLQPQAEIIANGNKYYADFEFNPEVQFDDYYANAKRKLVIECDGHEFHQKTKEQVIKDNQREYDLKMAGYEVLRFSGSEIYNTPYACAEKTLNYIKKLIEE